MGDFLRTHWMKFAAAGIVAMVIGFILFIVGIYYVATGEKSTIGEQLFVRIDHYDTWARKEVAGTAGKVTTPSFPVVSPVVVTAFSAQTQVIWTNGTVTLYDETYLKTTIPFTALNAASSGGSVKLSFSLTYTTIQGSPTQTHTSTVTTAAIPLSNGSHDVNHICAVISRKYANSEWLIDADKESCFYPFTASSNKYGAAVGNVLVSLRSRFDPMLYIEEKSEGVYPVADGNVLVVDPSTPTLLGFGAFLLVAGLVVLIVFCCFCRPKPLDGQPVVAPGQTVQQGVPVQQQHQSTTAV